MGPSQPPLQGLRRSLWQPAHDPDEPCPGAMENPAYVQVTQKLLLNQSIGNRFNAKKNGQALFACPWMLVGAEVGIIFTPQLIAIKAFYNINILEYPQEYPQIAEASGA